MQAKKSRGGGGSERSWELEEIQQLIDVLIERGVDEAPFVKLGDVVRVEQVLCIIEAMKLMNEIESDVAGEIFRVYVESGQPVEYGQSLFAIKPSHKR